MLFFEGKPVAELPYDWLDVIHNLRFLIIVFKSDWFF